jgi:16S rRNA U516 pseudouridylate synthase RsuA-like enzyme
LERAMADSNFDEDGLNMAIRKFLKEVGVTSQREIERVVHEGKLNRSSLHLKMVLTSDNEPSLKHVVEHQIELKR